ncbi:MAG TPA: DUF4386 domain-containing protein [Thermoanaerobaculia bacterium]|nr:DUF4386 domain-containing protein [Thermoanaerobaculia bacterium]
MHPTKKDARIAGLLYLLMAIPGPFSLMYVPGKLIVSGNAAATANNIMAHEMLFRLSILGILVSGIGWLVLALALYRLFSGVDKAHASLLVIFVAVSVAISYLVELNQIGALILLRGGDFLAVFDKPQREALAYLFIKLHGQGITINEMFWGLWLIPFGWLVIKSRFLPRILGAWLLVNGLAYMAISFTGLLFPPYGAVVFNKAFPILLGELAIMFWLLIRGLKENPAAATISERAAAAA